MRYLNPATSLVRRGDAQRVGISGNPGAWFCAAALGFALLLANAPVALGADTTRVFANLTRPDSVPSDDVLMANNAVIGEITYQLGGIFDTSQPDENYYIFRLANRLHINTKEFVVRDDLLFNTGDPYSPELISESERILRAKNYLFDARILPIRYEDNRVDIEIRTRDVWTLSGGINYSHKGGESSYGFEIQEDNFAGLGKMVRIKRDTDEFRTENEFQYYDPYLTKQRVQLTAGYSYNSDGRSKIFKLERPFFSLDTHWSGGVHAETFSREEIIYKDGEEYDRYYQDDEYYDIRGGYSRGQIGEHTGRWQLGFTKEVDRFSPSDATKDISLVPEDRDIGYPWIHYESIESRFIKTSRIDKIGRTEDINLGAIYHVQLGWSREDFGSDRDALIFDFNYYNTNRAFSDHLWLISVGGSGRVGEGFTENLLFNSNARYFLPMGQKLVFYSELTVDVGHNLDGDTQLLLGGESGLRGYPARIQEGNRRVLFRMEERYYTDFQILQLAYIAGAAFFDIGQAWTPGVEPERYAGFLKDVGLGLRLAPSRTSSGNIIHFDWAYALDAEGGDENFQFVVSTETQF